MMIILVIPRRPGFILTFASLSRNLSVLSLSHLQTLRHRTCSSFIVLHVYGSVIPITSAVGRSLPPPVDQSPLNLSQPNSTNSSPYTTARGRADLPKPNVSCEQAMIKVPHVPE